MKHLSGEMDHDGDGGENVRGGSRVPLGKLSTLHGRQGTVPTLRCDALPQAGKLPQQQQTQLKPKSLTFQICEVG